MPRYEVGGQISPLQDSEFLVPAGQRTEVGFGGRFTWNVSRFIAADSQIDYYEGERFSGRRIQGLVGVKAGIRKNRIGVFGKVRPGVLRTNLPLVCAICSFGSGRPFEDPFPDHETVWSLAVDTGAVVEAYPTRRLVIRFDVGDVYLKLKRSVIIGFDRGQYKLDPFYLETHTLHGDRRRLQVLTNVSSSADTLLGRHLCACPGPTSRSAASPTGRFHHSRS